jgi:hypothetical protein
MATIANRSAAPRRLDLEPAVEPIVEIDGRFHDLA